MELNRRSVLMLGAGAAVAATIQVPAFASTDELAAAIQAFTGGAPVGEGGVTIGAPEIAENGNTVPVEVSAEGATSILVLATGNPNPGIATFNFGPLAASSHASTRIRLAKTQDVLAVAKMADGSFTQSKRTVKVTIGGCGG